MRKLILLILLLVSSYLLLPLQTKAAPEVAGERERLILKFRSITPTFYRENLVESYGLNLDEKLLLPRTYVVEVPRGTAERLMSTFSRNPLVEYAEKDFVAEAFETPNDPYFPDQWGLTKIEAPGAWDTTHGSSSVNIAIVDTGINSSHADLAGKIEKSVDCTSSSSCPDYVTTDPNGHGTHVAGIASAITGNGEGISGISWDASLYSVKVLDDTGSGYYSWVANGIVWATDNGAEVINLSLGGTSSSSTLRNAVDYAWERGVVVAAAAGNTGTSSRHYPAYYSNTIAVAATDQADNKASFSTYGRWVDVAAPGLSILSSYKGGYASLSGTSMATPHVAGLAGLIFGQNPAWSNSQVREQIELTADAISGTGPYWTYGRINVCTAVGCGDLGGPSPTPTPTNSPTPTSSPSPTPTLSPTPTPSPSPTLTPTPAPTVTPTATPTPSPSSSPAPWWCQYFPRNRSCS